MTIQMVVQLPNSTHPTMVYWLMTFGKRGGGRVEADHQDHHRVRDVNKHHNGILLPIP